ncbi:amidohydrolase family protein [Mesorhizobium sp. B4-1-4]|uniref:amidohydrolase family protein n=1 Tax=Mesorhizobium sp. B4-1-4 TaxID=2589888 RepID=UPI00112CFF7E|nr:amidohydrolase family protein [Mesorhizobium sp. B4-1-4]UCI31865.1 amidohydrolase family protein [Mesorhizobium sp. B4-1-4]
MTIPTIDLPLIDHHTHGVIPKDLDYKQFQQAFSESYLPPPDGATEFQKPLGLAIRRFCPPILDLEPHVSGERYVERRLELGATEVNRRFLRAGGFERLIIDTGFKSDSILNVEQMAEIAAVPANEVVRIEAVAEDVVRSGVDAAGFADSFRERLLSRSRDAIGLKTIVAYRTTFKVDQSRPAENDLAAAAGEWMKEIETTGKVRLTHPVLVRAALWTAGDICRQRKFPLQVHSGLGDDVYIHACDPSHFTDFIKSMQDWEVPITLLHNYPFIREAGWLSEIYRNVYLDTGVVQNYTGPSSARIIQESLETAKFSKLLFSTDAIGLSELYYLGSVLFRRGLKIALDQWLSDDFITLQDADEIIQSVAYGNARRIYNLEA